MSSNIAPITVICDDNDNYESLKIAITFFADYFGFTWERYLSERKLGQIVLIISNSIDILQLKGFSGLDFKDKFVLWVNNNTNQLSNKNGFKLLDSSFTEPIHSYQWFFPLVNTKNSHLFPIVVLPKEDWKTRKNIPMKLYKDYFHASILIYIDFPVFKYFTYLLTGVQPKDGGTNKFHVFYNTDLPIIDLFLDFCWNSWINEAQKKDLPLVKISRWPKGVEWVVAPSHDIDHLFYRSRFAPLKYWLLRFFDGQWPSLSYLKDSIIHALRIRRLGWGFNEILKIESKMNVRSTFFILREAIEKVKTVNKVATKEFLNKMSTLGWEIQLHPCPKEAEDTENLEDSVEWIEENIHVKRSGVRNHYLTFNYPYTWEIQWSVNLTFDSSIGFSKKFGCRAGTCLPYRTLPPDKQHVEIPMIGMDTFWDTSSNSSWFKKWAGVHKKHGRQRIIDYMRLTHENNGVFAINWHNARFHLPYRRDYEKILLQAKKMNASFMNYNEIARWWISRKELVCSIHYSKNTLSLTTTKLPEDINYVIEGFIPENVSLMVNNKEYQLGKDRSGNVMSKKG